MLRTNLMCLILLLFSVIAIAIDNYGPFDAKMTTIKACKGPKRKDCSIYKPWLNKNSTYSCDMVVKQNVELTMGKMYATRNNKDTLKMQMGNPCTHVASRPVLNIIFKMTDKCVILKGRYSIHLNMSDMFTKYYAGSFIYGNWSYKIVFFSEECNFACTIINFDNTPKKKL